MSVTANIVTQVAPDVLEVPVSAVKTQGGSSYIQELTNPDPAQTGVTGVTSKTAPTLVPVTIGVSDGSDTEILSGVNEGDQIVVQTITTSTTTKTTTAPSILGGTSTRGFGGGGFGGGGAARPASTAAGK
jgi:multidrug efflux pump subunit AcrA (membrane-fusion protein)